MNVPPVGFVYNTVDSHVSHPGFQVPDPFGLRRGPYVSFFDAILATAFFRCWHILLFFGGWSSLITALNATGHKVSIQSTLLTVVGTVLGFVISYRTTSSFERYNEGRRLWSQVVLANRNFARTVWIHVSDPPASRTITSEEQAARSAVEKKSVINLLEAFAVSLKHYLRGEDGIFYKDLYHLVKHLPGYAMPAGRPSIADTSSYASPRQGDSLYSPISRLRSPSLYQQQRAYLSAPNLSAPDIVLPHPVTTTSATPQSKRHPSTTFLEPLARPDPNHTITRPPGDVSEKDEPMPTPRSRITPSEEELILLPAYMPPKYHLFDLFPFSLLVKWLTVRGRDVKGKKAARLRARMLKKVKMGHGAGGGNLPLEITLYLSSYISAVQTRHQADVPTLNTLIGALNQLVEALTGLERILTTPIPFSYSFHLWAVTMIYCLALPFQIWSTLKWMTIPGTVIVSFMFFGFLVAGEEIENPFGYDKNDLNLDYFTHNIIRNELRALTSMPPPDPGAWAFSGDNDMLFTTRDADGNEEHVTPDEWVRRGHRHIQNALRTM